METIWITILQLERQCHAMIQELKSVYTELKDSPESLLDAIKEIREKYETA